MRRTVDLQWLFEQTHPIPFSGCWAWAGGLDKDGYGKVKVAGRDLRAHRVAFEVKYGPIPDGFLSDHLCRVRCCVNPDHLDVVTPSVNILRGILPAMTRTRNRSPEMRALSAKPKSEAHKEAMSQATARWWANHPGTLRPMSPEHKEKTSAILVERNRSPEMRAIASKPKSAAHREALRQAALRRWAKLKK